MKLVLTGAAGFLGWHTRVRLRALTGHQVTAVTRADWDRLPDALRGADAVLHVAGVNRGPAADVEAGNVELARQVADAVRCSGSRPRIVYANSVQSGAASAYGAGKQLAAEILHGAAGQLGSEFVDVRLPHLFGEHGRPGYNSFVATFADAVLRGTTPAVQDREIALLHAQQAAQQLIDALAGPGRQLHPAGTPTTVATVLHTLEQFARIYRNGDIPCRRTDLDVDLFNVLRAAGSAAPFALQQHTDPRGALIELVRSHGGQGATFVSTTAPGASRGEHFHLRKFERFVVLAGRARISMRRLFTDDVVDFVVTGDRPTAVDMPTLWAHRITNIGTQELTTLFWASEILDPQAPDTFAEPVGPGYPAAAQRTG